MNHDITFTEKDLFRYGGAPNSKVYTLDEQFSMYDIMNRRLDWSQPAETTLDFNDDPAFVKLSEVAQDIVVNAVLGVYDLSGPPEMNDEIKAEIAQWAATQE